MTRTRSFGFRMARTAVILSDAVALRAAVAAAWAALVSLSVRDPWNPLWRAGPSASADAASQICLAAGLCWAALCVRIVLRRGPGATTWTRDEHLAACALAGALALAGTMSGSLSVLGVGAAMLVVSVLDARDALRARSLIREFGCEGAAARFREAFATPEDARRRAAALLSVRDEACGRLAHEVLYRSVPEGASR